MAETLSGLDGRTFVGSGGSRREVPAFLEVLAMNDGRLPDPRGTAGWILRFPSPQGGSHYGVGVRAGGDFEQVVRAVGSLAKTHRRVCGRAV